MKTPESRKPETREELAAAIDTLADDKINGLRARYGDNEKLAVILQSTIERIRTTQLNFHQTHTEDILKYAGNTPVDVVDIFRSRLDTLSIELESKSERYGSPSTPPQSPVTDIRSAVKGKVRRAA